MQAACEAGDVFGLLEGGCGGARAAADCLAALYGTVRDPWLTRALLMYHARTGSARALDVLARAPDPHARHLLDALLDQLRGGERGPALAALAPLVARRPAWLHLVPAHGVARELLRAARSERSPVPLLHALLALAALVPAAPSLAGAHASDLAEALVRAGGGDAHAALAARALFRAVYATHPCAVVEALREAGGGWRAAAALVAGVRLHPALVAGARAREAEAARWARSEPHDVLAACRRLALPPRDSPAPDAAPDAPPLVWRHSPAPPPPPGSTAQASRAAGALRPGGDGWFALGERSGAEAAPHTPLPAEPAPEPEPAVEATPENTPRLAFRFPSEAPRDAYSARLARVAADRRAADSPVHFGGAPPAAAARPEPRRPDTEPEDSEVRDLTARPAPPADWLEPDPAPAPAPDPRRAAPAPRPRRGDAPPPRRAPSAGPAPRRPRTEAAVQTVDTWPEPYEFLIADFYRSLPDDTDQSMESSEPCERLDAYLAELYAGRAGAGAGGAGTGAGGAGTGAGGAAELAEQLALAHAHLMYERWRREAHAERNRRLLGRCRQVRALELANGALQERVRALTRERDALRARGQDAAPAGDEAPEGGGGALEAALQAERAARLRAEAERAEAERRRARDAAELQRARADQAEAARHVEAMARAALAAERRGEHVRRLRRELLVLAEREARLGAAAAAAPPPPPPAAAESAERALRAAAARAEADAEAAGARADAAAARAHELETALAARDAALADLKRAARHAAEESAARLKALRDKYAALLCVVRAQEGRGLERLAAAPPGGAPAHNSD